MLRSYRWQIAWVFRRGHAREAGRQRTRAFGLLKWWLVIGLLLVTGLLLAYFQFLQKAGSAQILFLSWDAAGQVQLYRTEIDDHRAQQLTAEQSGIQDYALSPDGRWVAYTTANPAGTTIWIINVQGEDRRPLLDCSPDVCGAMVWHPDGQRLVYERRGIGADDVPGAPRLWWLDPFNGETAPLLEDSEQISQSASFSPDGQWLSYVGSPDDGLFVFNFDTRTHLRFPSEMGTPAVWSPDSRSLLFRNNQVIVSHSAEDPDHLGHSHDFSLGVYLFRVDLANSDSVESLSGSSVVDDASPTWQPGGEWIVFGRKQPRTSMGRQLWMMRPDGSEAHALTDNPAVHHGLPAWSLDGQSLLFQRYSTLEPGTRPSIWQVEPGTGEQRQIVSTGFQPSWLP